MNKGTIYCVYWKGCNYLRHFYKLEDAIEWCKNEIEKEVKDLYVDIGFRYCVDEKSNRYCLVGYNGGFGNIMDYEIDAIDVY